MRLRYILSAAAALTAIALLATEPVNPSPPDNDDSEELDADADTIAADNDEDDRNVRENPVIEYDDEIDIPVPSFINRSINHINLNGADWSSLRSAIAQCALSPVTIIHIGDSHIQADIATGTTRDLLQYDYGNAGRGIITPLKMSGTNEPRDYTFTGSGTWDALKLMKAPWKRTMGFTGTSVHPCSASSRFSVGTTTRSTVADDDYDPFTSMLIFHHGKLNITEVTDANDNHVDFKAIPSHDYTQLILSRPLDKATVDFDTNGDLTLYGVSLTADRPGIIYSAIGNNGATYDTYNRVGTLGSGISPLHPALVIISLGGNEAFGRLDTRAFIRNVDRLVSNIRQSNPDAQILLVTPMECHKSIYTTKYVKKKVPVKSRKRGKKGRKKKSKTTYVTKNVKTKVKSYGVNTNVAPLREALLQYGADNNIAVYDWYNVAGGKGASNTWISNGLFSTDRVHHSAKGYHIQGRLLYEALIEQLGRPQ